MKLSRLLLIVRVALPLMFAISPVVSYAADQYLIDIFSNLDKSLQPIWQFLIALCYVLGIWFVAIAILKLKQYGQMTVMMATHASMASSIAYLAVGTGLLFVPTLLDVSVATLWDYGVNDIRAYDAAPSYADIINPILDLVKIIGLIAFMRGWILLIRLGNHGGSPPGTVGKAIAHMVGGILAINITGTLDVLKATFGL